VVSKWQGLSRARQNNAKVVFAIASLYLSMNEYGGVITMGWDPKKHCWNNNWQKKQYQGLDHNSRESVRGRRNNEVSKKTNLNH